MTLKEKFHQWLRTEPFNSRDAVSLREAQCEVIADEFAIGFANFIDDLIGEYGLFGFKENFGEKTTEELLKIYKKEKGL